MARKRLPEERSVKDKFGKEAASAFLATATNSHAPNSKLSGNYEELEKLLGREEARKLERKYLVPNSNEYVIRVINGKTWEITESGAKRYGWHLDQERIEKRLPVQEDSSKDTLVLPRGPESIHAQLSKLAREQAESSALNKHEILRVVQQIAEDFGSAVEGMTKEQKRQFRIRSSSLVKQFKSMRESSKRMHCDECQLDPSDPSKHPMCHGLTPMEYRSLLEAHHKNPIAEGLQRTKPTDEYFALLCANCHRIAHVRLRREKAV